MYLIIAGLIFLVALALALYSFLRKGELEAIISALEKDLREREAASTAELDSLRADLAKLERLRHIPGVIEKARRTEQAIEASLEEARKKAAEIIAAARLKSEKMGEDAWAILGQARGEADAIVDSATQEANSLKDNLLRAIEGDVARAKEARKVAEWQANNILEEARKQAKEIAKQARKEAKEKTGKVEETLDRATTYALKVRQEAEKRAAEICGGAYEALKRRESSEATAKAMENVASGYAGTFMIPTDHLLDELAEEYGFHEAGERLRVARERTRIMEKNGTAATCNYPEGWKRDYAISFVLSAFNGKVDSILARIKPANQGKMIQEIKDAFALVNHNGEVFRNARIQEEYLDARLEELKWAVAVQRVKEKEREEQRAIREQIREEEKARKEYERAIKQAQRDEDLLSQALEKVRREYDAAAVEDRAKYESRLRDLSERLEEAEEKNQRALSMAQQTKCGYIYIISNVGSFGDDVYKIGLTRRLEPLDRVRELGDASVPFSFDVHALIYSEDAPALEAALHRRFVRYQVNKVNRRKEFFRLKLQEVRDAIEGMKIDAKWTLAAEARDYRETLALERQMRDDAEYQRRWAEEQAALVSRPPFDDEGEESTRDDDRCEDRALDAPLDGDLDAAVSAVGSVG